MYTIEQILDCIEKAKCWKCETEKSLWLDEEGGLHSSYRCKVCDAEVYISYDRVMAEPIVLFDGVSEEEIEVYDK
jgi:hypothetical protein